MVFAKARPSRVGIRAVDKPTSDMLSRKRKKYIGRCSVGSRAMIQEDSTIAQGRQKVSSEGYCPPGGCSRWAWQAHRQEGGGHRRAGIGS